MLLTFNYDKKFKKSIKEGDYDEFLKIYTEYKREHHDHFPIVGEVRCSDNENGIEAQAIIIACDNIKPEIGIRTIENAAGDIIDKEYTLLLNPFYLTSKAMSRVSILNLMKSPFINYN